MSIAPNYSDEYRRKCFDTWVLAGRPSAPKLVELIPANEMGDKPSHQTILKWIEDEGWYEHADLIQTSAVEIADQDLIQSKAEMLKAQFRDAVAIAKKAKAALVEKGFDTSAAAVNAYFKAVEEQRKVAGISEFMEKVGNMTDEQIEAEIAQRLSEMKDAVVGETIDEPGNEPSADPDGS